MFSMSVAAVISTALGVFLGGLITLGVAWWFHRRASSHLEDKVDRLERLITLVALYLQKDGVLEDVELDDEGKLKGFTQTIYAPFIPSEGKVYPPTLTQKDPPEDYSE